jgi:hypothetical protein
VQSVRRHQQRGYRDVPKNTRKVVMEECPQCHGKSQPFPSHMRLITRDKIHSEPVIRISNDGKTITVGIHTNAIVIAVSPVRNGKEDLATIKFTATRMVVPHDELNMSCESWHHCICCGGEGTVEAAWRRRIEGKW